MKPDLTEKEARKRLKAAMPWIGKVLVVKYRLGWYCGGSATCSEGARKGLLCTDASIGFYSHQPTLRAAVEKAEKAAARLKARIGGAK